MDVYETAGELWRWRSGFGQCAGNQRVILGGTDDNHATVAQTNN